MTMNVTRAYENLDRRLHAGKKPKPGFRSRIPARFIDIFVRDDGHPVLTYLHPTKGRRTVVMPKSAIPRQEAPAVPGLEPEIVS